MKRHPSEHPMKMMTEALKQEGDYHAPGKAFVWGLAISQWFGILIMGGMFLAILISMIVIATEPLQKKRPGITSSNQIKPTEKQMEAENLFIEHIKDVVHFVEVSAKSVNERQQILHNVLETTKSYTEQPLDQKALEQKLAMLASDLRHCTIAKGRYLTDFFSITNPFNNPALSNTFEELLGDQAFTERHVLDPQEENKRWEALCDFCQREVKKTNEELVRVLDTSANIQNN